MCEFETKPEALEEETTPVEETTEPTPTEPEAPVAPETEPEAPAQEEPVEPAVEEPAAKEPVEEPVEEPIPEEPAQPDPAIAQILTVTEGLSEQLAALEKLFNTRIMHAAHEDRIIEQMHKELQQYKNDLYSQLVRPILMDIIDVRDSIMRLAAVYRAKPEGEQNIPNKTFADYSYDLQDILEKNNVEIYRSNPGDAFVPVRQRVIKKVPTADESLHGKVAETMTCGYSYNGRVISPEKISIYYYEKPAEPAEDK